ncbi:hypothetical protein ACWDR5_13860 [Streptomyces koyangensis]
MRGGAEPDAGPPRPDGLPVADFLLHVEPGEARARFRWSDEPVEDPAREDPVSPPP